ncbi:MAG: YihY/virulence factor BrkB family protein, partial [Bacteroidota bacterium]
MIKIKLKEAKNLIIETIEQLDDDKWFKLAGSLSFYTMLSLAPLLVVIIAIAGFIFGTDAATGGIVSTLESYTGEKTAMVIQNVIKNASEPETGLWATIISSVIFMFASATVFVDIKESLNIIWGVELKPGKPVKSFLKNRITSFLMVLATGFVLILSLFTNIIIRAISKYFSERLPHILPLLDWANNILFFILIAILFAIMFRYLPSVRVIWKYVWIGSIMTSFLFALGKYMISIYFAFSSTASFYGASGSLVALLIWIYYSGVIFFFGAEFTQVYRNKYAGKILETKNSAIKVAKTSQLITDVMQKNNKVEQP